MPRLSAVLLAISLSVCVVWSIVLGNERVHQISLIDRVLRYYARHAPDKTPEKEKLSKLLMKYSADTEHRQRSSPTRGKGKLRG